MEKTFQGTTALLCLTCLVASCGFKGDLYLPKPGDDATFGPVQTGIGLSPNAPIKETKESAAPEKDIEKPHTKDKNHAN